MGAPLRGRSIALVYALRSGRSGRLPFALVAMVALVFSPQTRVALYQWRYEAHTRENYASSLRGCGVRYARAHTRFACLESSKDYIPPGCGSYIRTAFSFAEGPLAYARPACPSKEVLGKNVRAHAVAPMSEAPSTARPPVGGGVCVWAACRI